jgi:hypothetical protein
MPRDAVHQLLATDVALDKLGARGISAGEAEQLPRNRHVVVAIRARALKAVTGDCWSGVGTVGGRSRSSSSAPRIQRRGWS